MYRNLLKIYRIMFRYWGYLVGGFVFMLLFALASGFSVTMVIPLFDYVFKRPEGAVPVITTLAGFREAMMQALGRAVSGSSPFSFFSADRIRAAGAQLGSVLEMTDPELLLWIVCGGVLGLIVVKNIFYYINRILFANLRGRAMKDARAMMFYRYLQQSLAFFSKNRVGDSIIRITSDINSVSNLCISATFNISRAFVLLIVYMSTALVLNARLFGLSILLFPLYGLVVSRLGGKLKKYAKRTRAQTANLFSNVAEKLYNMNIVKVFAKEDEELGTFNRMNHKYLRLWLRSMIYSSFSVPLSEMNGTVVGIIVLLIGGGQVIAGAISLGEFTAFLFAVFSMLNPIKVFTKAFMNFKKASASLERITEILDRTPDVVENPDARPVTGFSESIVLDRVGFSYGGDPVLQDISLTIAKGEKIALVGISGSGKTTLVNLLPRLYDVTSGEIRFDGVRLQDLDYTGLRTRFGMVTQESILFNDTIRNNIAYGSREAVSDEQIRNAARIAYADGFIEQLPEKYGHLLNAKASNLSGGQKQRLCIARAIVSDPPVLIFDEATSALDSEAEQKVQQAIDSATRNRTVVVIAHRLSTVLASDRIAVMEQGRIVGLGPHEELLKTCGRYRSLYELQFSVQEPSKS